METVNYKYIITFLLTILISSCKENDIINQPPSNFKVNINEVLNKSASISWNESVDPEGSQVFYDIYLDEKKISDNFTQLTFNFTNLEEGTAHSGKIEASDPLGNETTVKFNFKTSTNQPPTTFDVTVSSKDPFSSRLDWSEAIDPEGEEVLYSVFLNGELIAENINRSSYFLPYLKGLTSYSGYIEATDSIGKTTKSNFYFVTELKVHDGNVFLKNQNQVNDFGSLAYNKIKGSLIIGVEAPYLSDVSNLSPLNTIQTVTRDIYLKNTFCKNLKGLSITHTGDLSKLNITGNSELSTLEGLEGLSKIYSININHNKSLLSFKGLHNLISVYDLKCEYNQSLISLEILDGLSVSRNLHIVDNKALINLKGLSNIKFLDKLSISSNENLKNLEGLNNLERSARIVSIYGNPSLTNMTGLTNLKSVANISIEKNSGITSLNGLENLTRATNSVKIKSNKNLETLEGINNIVFRDGYTKHYTLEIFENGKIINLDALSDYRFTDGSGEFYVQSNPELVNFCGLTELTKSLNVDNINENLIFILNKFNPTYEEMLNGKCSL